jgi:hypothetical protein
VKEPFVFGYWKLVIFQDSFKQRMTKIDFSNQFFYLFKGLNWMAPKWRNCSRFAAVSFSEGYNQIASIFTKDREVVCNACGIPSSSFKTMTSCFSMLL